MYFSNTTRRSRLLSRNRFDFGALFTRARWKTNSLALWISVITGIAVLVVSALTDYKLGALRTIPFQGHLTIDLAVAIAFMVIPFAFGFQGLDAHYYWVNAAVVFTVVSLSATKEEL